MNKLIIILLIICINTLPCSTFRLKSKSSYFVGKNYDWDIESGRIFINKKNVNKVAFKVNNPISWTSKYGSITFNQYGQEFPIGGMNEKGLVIEALWLPETDYPSNDANRQAIDNVQWIQYHLDNSATIEEVIKNDSLFQLSPITETAIHCFITDKNGKSLIFESINGVTHHYKADAFNYPFLTNNPYEKSVKMINRCKEFGGKSSTPQGKESISRFIQLGVALKNYPLKKLNPIDYSFNMLDNVSLGDYTKWSIVYDLENLLVYYKTASSKHTKIIDMNKFNLNCTNDTKSIRIINNKKGNISNFFEKSTVEHNKKMVLNSFKNTSFLRDMNPQYIKEIYNYPFQFECN